MESVRQILLIVQLFFNDGNPNNQARVHIPFQTLEECYEAAQRVQTNVREWEDRKVVAIGAGCYQEFGDPT